MNKKKVYCKDCKYCGKPVYLTLPPNMSIHMPLEPMKIFYMHGIEIEQRYCKNPKIPKTEEIDTFYKHIKNNYRPQCHELNGENDCKYYKEVK